MIEKHEQSRYFDSQDSEDSQSMCKKYLSDLMQSGGLEMAEMTKSAFDVCSRRRKYDSKEWKAKHDRPLCKSRVEKLRRKRAK